MGGLQRLQPALELAGLKGTYQRLDETAQLARLARGDLASAEGRGDRCRHRQDVGGIAHRRQREADGALANAREEAIEAQAQGRRVSDERPFDGLGDQQPAVAGEQLLPGLSGIIANSARPPGRIAGPALRERPPRAAPPWLFRPKIIPCQSLLFPRLFNALHAARGDPNSDGSAIGSASKQPEDQPGISQQ